MKRMKALVMVLGLAAVSVAGITTPGDIAGLYLHLNADTIALANGAAVTSWTDSANGIVFGGTASYLANYANNHAAVKFGGGTNGLWNINLLGTSGSPTMAGVTLFMVANVDSGGGYLCEGNNPSGTRMRINADAGTAKNYQVRVGGGASTSGGTLDNVRHVYTIVSGQPSPASPMSFLMDNSVVIAPATYAAGSLQMNGFSIGCSAVAGVPSSGAVCSIAEVLMYNKALTNAEITDVNNYLAAKYVPEPATLILLGIGSLVALKRKK